MSDFPIITADKNSLKNRRLIYGVGNNNAPYMTNVKIDGKRIICPIYKIWTSMLRRCYAKTNRVGCETYHDCTVCSEWLDFMSFRAWVINQKWKGMELDKDLKVFGARIYSPETCAFIPKQINMLFSDSKKARGKYPIGVTFSKKQGLFHARVRKYGVLSHIGFFDNPNDAHNAYILEKTRHINEVASTCEDWIRDLVINYWESAFDSGKFKLVEGEYE